MAAYGENLMATHTFFAAGQDAICVMNRASSSGL